MSDEAAVPAASRWQRTEAWAEQQSERLNAILIREIRRALNGRIFIASFLVLLGICVLVCLSTVFTQEFRSGSGRNVFSSLLACLCGISYLGLPFILSGMLHTEMRERTLELLSITTITAARIVWGEVLTALGLFTLFASAVAPFMAFSYLLGGVDLRMMATGFALVFLGTMLLSLMAVVGAVQRAAEAATRGGVIILALFAFGSTLTYLLNPWSGIESFWDDPHVGWNLLLFFVFYFSVAGILFALAVARLTFASANRSAPIRLAVTAHLAALGTLAAVDPRSGYEVFIVWCFYSMCVLFLLGIMVVGEEETLTRRQRRPGRFRSRFPTLWSFFLPGARRGLGLVFGLAILVSAATELAALTSPSRPVQGASFRLMSWVLTAYLVLYLVLSQLFCALLPSLFRRPVMRRLMPVILFLVTLLLPLLAMLLGDVKIDNSPSLAALNPCFYFPLYVDSWRSHSDAKVAGFIVMGLGLVALVAAAPGIIKSITSGASALLKPPEPAA